jgi:CheY-like chemotaxis protein
LGDVSPNLVEAEDGEVAYRLLCAAPADLVLTDINMPKRDGLELIGDIRKRWPQTLVIAVTGGSRAATPDLLLKTAALMGAFVVTKPVRGPALRELVCKVLGVSTRDMAQPAAAGRSRFAP